MKLLTTDIRKQMISNGELRQLMQDAGHGEPDFSPVVKLFTPDASCSWLLTEIDPDNPDLAFGLCDLGFGRPELGSVSLSELARVRGPFGLAIERDRYFRADKKLSAYTNEARAQGAIKA